VAFTVEQDFEPDNPRGSVSVSVGCTEGGAPDESPKSASENASAVFAISDFGADATCTATVRDVPAGYTTDASDCLNVSITGSDSPSCTITSRKKAASVTFTVTKDFEPDNQASIRVSVGCTRGGRPNDVSKPVREGEPAVFVIRDFRSGATCTATEEGAPDNYTSSERGCRGVAIARGKPAACTIINTLDTPDSVTFTVNKDFDPDEPDSSVSISLNCTDGETPDDLSKPATEGEPAVFVLSGFGPGATCTATEGAAPDGYTSNERDCLSVAIAEKRFCTITNKLNFASFSVHREFTDGHAGSVVLSLTCDSGTGDPARGTAREGSPAVFTVSGFTADAACTATTIKVASGYRHDDMACQSVPVDARECTIVYEPPG
jgi:hypothetical protein